MSALDHRHPSQARYRRNLRRALAVAVAVHAILFAVVPAYTAAPPRSERDWIRMVDVRPWRSREPWPGSPGSNAPSAGGRVSAEPPTADAEPVRMESAAQVETTPAAPPASAGVVATGGGGGAGTGGGAGLGGGTGDGDEPPVFYAYDVAPRVIRRVEPVYPLEARSQGLQGTVVLHVNLDERGRILRAWVARADAPEALIRAAMDAIYQFEFEPGRQKDMAVPCTVAIPFLFHLERVLDSGRK